MNFKGSDIRKAKQQNISILSTAKGRKNKVCADITHKTLFKNIYSVREQTYGHHGGKVGGDGGGGMNWKIGIDICTLISIK